VKNKLVIGLVSGAVLGALDGATAWFTPAVRDAIGTIIPGAAFKGMVVGLLCGWFARKVQSTPLGIALGAGLGLLFAYAVASLQPKPYYLEMMLPGFVTGALIGYLTQTFGTKAGGERNR
jgi:F0F1-type ATP synthase assembly protein I